MSSDTLNADADGARTIGPYRLVCVLGEGSMGRVWLADQDQPRRQVALKIAHGAQPSLLARMRREIDTLAALEHPGIARLYAAGETRSGDVDVPWLAMEYVRGVDLLGYVRTAHCDLSSRLRLFVDVVRTVQFAHDRGVIHRDLKPGNILVDEEGRTKILDFGIAYRLGDESAGLTLAGQVLGTLPYMSPEQLNRGERGADARSDVYALGAIAYELVSGRLPHPELATATLFEALDILRREPAPALASVSIVARGDLNTVVMKALADEPALRYASAAAFADDLQRVLDRRPVAARPPTLAYRATRFVHRHRALSAAAASVFAILLAASAISLRFAFAERDAWDEAEKHAQESAAVNAFLQHMLASANPELTGGRNPSVAELI
ncbi:MAG: serine/threonine protein kinase, partial [Proteobacteria bacterium]|nr:serine/threonine protein kinase [Pseudomonadota bacterium]